MNDNGEPGEGHDTDAEVRDQFTALFELAVQITDAGFDVLPAAVWDRGDGTLAKAPLTRHGHLEAHHDPQLLLQQLITPYVPQRVPDNYEPVVAFIPGSGGCGVLDCDAKHGKVGLHTLQSLIQQYGNFVGAAWRSPSGGVNVLFRKPPGDQRFGNVSPWPGIDVRVDGGWVVAPGNTSSLGAWAWINPSTFSTTQPPPDGMVVALTPASPNGPQPKVDRAEVRAFIEASPTDTPLPSMQAFDRKLAAFRQSTTGSRHEALKDIIGFICGMHALDLRWALEKIKDEWLILTAGEGREDEVGDMLSWTVAQEMVSRLAAPAAIVPLEVIGNYQPDIYIDWKEFAKRDMAVRPWLVEGLWPEGRAIALWANAKEGKSELALWCAAKLAMGEHPWTGVAMPPVDIAYFDYEMTEDDLDERLNTFGFDLDRLEHLHYALLPPFPALNQANGGEVLLEHTLRVNARAVVIDTFARAVIGAENDADTTNDFFTYTGSRLKQAGIGLWRTDHAGAAQTKRPRGSTAKLADVDVTWRLIRKQAGVKLTCANGSRLSWVGPELLIDRLIDQQTGEVSYSMPVTLATVPPGVPAKAAELDAAGIPLDMGRPAVRDALKAKGISPGKHDVLSAAIKYRREQQKGTGVGGQPQEQLDDDPLDLFSDQAKQDGDS